MPYTRRSVLRDAALVSLAGAAASPSLTLLGCTKKSKPAAAAKPAFSGVRVFFTGAWLFCSDGNGAMYAIARDMFDSSGIGTHTFPFGRWRPPAGTKPDFDTSMPLLGRNPPKDNLNHPQPYAIAITPAPGPGILLPSVFQDAQTMVPFAYLDNPKDTSGKFPLTLDTTMPGLRMISLPVPTQIRAAGFLKDGKIHEKPGKALLHPPPSGVSYTVSGFATTHIFDYPNATSLTFTAGSVTDTIHSTDSIIDYHFHTVPPPNTGEHGPKMFCNLISLLSCNWVKLTEKDLSLTIPCPPKFQGGPHAPDNPAELDYDSSAPPPVDCTFLSDLASCSGPGFGVDGDPCS